MIIWTTSNEQEGIVSEHAGIPSQAPATQLPLISFIPASLRDKNTFNTGGASTTFPKDTHLSEGCLEDQAIEAEVRTQSKGGASDQWYEELNLVAKVDLLANITEMVRRDLSLEAHLPRCTMPDPEDLCGAIRERDSEIIDLESQLKEVSEENVNLAPHNEWLESQLADFQQKTHTAEEGQKTAAQQVNEMKNSCDQLAEEKRRLEGDLAKAREETFEAQEKERKTNVELLSLSQSHEVKVSDLEKKVLELESENRALNLALPTEEDRAIEQENIIADYTSSSVYYSALEEQADTGFRKGWAYARMRSELLGNAQPLGDYHDLSLPEMEELNNHHKEELKKRYGEENSDNDPCA